MSSAPARHSPRLINQQKDLALSVPRAYAKPGDYRIMAEPKTVETLLKCGGKNRTAMLKVAAPAQAAAPEAPTATSRPKPATAAGPQCPDGWKLDRKSINRKTGAYTCQAAPGTRAKARLSCPGDLGYFENVKKGIMGCRP